MEYFQDLKKTPIFKESTEFECQAMMFCFKTKFKTFQRNEQIVKQGDLIEDVILIVKGGAIAENVDLLGNINIVSELGRGDVYGLESAVAQEEVFRDTLVAKQKTLVLFMNKHRIINPCFNRCKRHEVVVKNIMKLVAESHIKLLDKLTHMSRKTTREKLLSYLIAESKKSDNEYFEIPFNKTELANYLSVDRSAMSTELNKMKEEGLVDFDKKRYRILEHKFMDL